MDMHRLPFPSDTNRLHLRLLSARNPLILVHPALLETLNISIAVKLSHICTFIPPYLTPIHHHHQSTECITVHNLYSFYLACSINT